MREWFTNSMPLRLRQLAVPAEAERIAPPETVTQLLPPDAWLIVAEGDIVAEGAPLCRLPRIGTFASVPGRTARIMPWETGPRGRFVAVIIERQANGDVYRLFDPIEDPSSLPVETLRDRCEAGGFNFPADDTPLLFSAVDEDVDRVTNRWSAEKQFDRMLDGLKLLRRLYGDRKIVIALSESLPAEKRNRCMQWGEVIVVPDRYPDTLSDLIIRRHPLLCGSQRVAVIDCRKLLALSTLLSTGKPMTTMPVSLRVGRKGKVRLFEVTIGMNIGQLLSVCGITPADGMQIVAGGEMRGNALDNLLQPLTFDTDSVLVLDKRELVRTVNRPCVNCGRCSRVCPAGLRVDLICKNIEFSASKEAIRLGIDSCIDCGLCGWVCIARRPLAHLMVFGKTICLSHVKTAGAEI